MNSISAKCRSGKRSGTPPPISSHIRRSGTIGPYTHCVIIRLDAAFSVIGSLTCAADSMTTFNVVASESSTLIPPVCVWMHTCMPLACTAAHTGS